MRKIFTKDNFIILMLLVIILMTCLYTCCRKKKDSTPIATPISIVDTVKEYIIDKGRISIITDSMKVIIADKEKQVQSTKQQLKNSQVIVYGLLDDVKRFKIDTNNLIDLINVLTVEIGTKDSLCDEAIYQSEQISSAKDGVIAEKDTLLNKSYALINTLVTASNDQQKKIQGLQDDVKGKKKANSFWRTIGVASAAAAAALILTN